MARRPDTSQARQLQAIHYTRSPDEKVQIDRILADHAFGWFQSSADFVTNILQDDRIGGVVNTRIGALQAAPFSVKPAREKRPDQKLAKEIGGDADKKTTGNWSEMMAPATQRELLKWGLMLGVGVGEIVWKREVRKWTPRVVVWHPRHLRFDWSRRRFVLQTDNLGEVVLPRPDEEPRGDGKWIVHCPWGVENGWLNALMRPLAYAYLARRWNFRDWSRYGEKHGLAILKAMVPSGAHQAEGNEAFMAGIANIGNEGVVMCPQAETKDLPSYDLQMVEPESRAWETFSEFKKALDVDIAVYVLGQNLTTEVQEGSRAASQTHDLIRIDKAKEDAALGPSLRSQMLTWYAQFNYGDPELAPRPEYQVEPAEDEAAEATTLKALGDAITALKAASARVDIDAILEKSGVPLLSEEEAALIEEERAAAAAEIAGAGGGGEGGGTSEPEDAEEDEDANPGETPKGGTQIQAGAIATGVVKRYVFAGLPIAVENPAGSHRLWQGEGGALSSTKMLCDYGFIEGYLSGDGEELDVYVGPDQEPREVYVVHQLKAPGYKAFDEDKIFLGFGSADEAKVVFCAHRNDGEQAFGGMTTIPFARFVAKLARRNPESTKKITATATPSPRTLVTLTKTVAGKRRAASYTETLEQRARARAAAVLRVDVEALVAEIGKATSLEDVRERVLRRYRGMDPGALAKVVERTNILANLSGRFSAVQEI
jgi:phage gp29-like protein